MIKVSIMPRAGAGLRQRQQRLPGRDYRLKTERNGPSNCPSYTIPLATAGDASRGPLVVVEVHSGAQVLGGPEPPAGGAVAEAEAVRVVPGPVVAPPAGPRGRRGDVAAAGVPGPRRGAGPVGRGPGAAGAVGAEGVEIAARPAGVDHPAGHR